METTSKLGAAGAAGGCAATAEARTRDANPIRFHRLQGIGTPFSLEIIALALKL
jgi:hypothetical protein